MLSLHCIPKSIFQRTARANPIDFYPFLHVSEQEDTGPYFNSEDNGKTKVVVFISRNICAWGRMRSYSLFKSQCYHATFIVLHCSPRDQSFYLFKEDLAHAAYNVHTTKFVKQE